MRGSPAALVGFSALLGLLILLVLFPLFVEPILLVQSALPALLLGLTAEVLGSNYSDDLRAWYEICGVSY